MDFLKDVVSIIVVALILAVFIRTFIVETYVVQGPSMMPTLKDGERLLVNKLAYRFSKPKHGDVIVFRYPLDPSKDYIKRVIGIEGDVIEIRTGRVYRNGQIVEEPYVFYPGLFNMSSFVVPPGTVFVMGDNRQNSEDSRSFGPVELRLIKGRASIVIWPFKFAGVIR